MHLLPLLLYAAAAAAYVAHFAWRDPRVGRLATALLAGGVLAHTFLIGMQTVQGGHAPLVGTSAAISYRRLRSRVPIRAPRDSSFESAGVSA